MARYAISRRRRNIIAVVCALAVSALCVLDHSCTSRRLSRPAQSVESQTACDIQNTTAGNSPSSRSSMATPSTSISPTATTLTLESGFGELIRLKPKTREQGLCISEKRRRILRRNSPSENRLLFTWKKTEKQGQIPSAARIHSTARRDVSKRGPA